MDDGSDLPQNAVEGPTGGLNFTDLPREEKEIQVKIYLTRTDRATLDRIANASPYKVRSKWIAAMLAAYQQRSPDETAAMFGSLHAMLSELLDEEQDRKIFGRRLDDLAIAMRDLTKAYLARGSE
jgi:hypothetical protein